MPEPERPRSEPEIIPPDQPDEARSQAHFSADAHGSERVYAARIGPLGAALGLLVAGVMAAAMLALLLGALLFALPLVFALVFGVVIAGLLRAFFRDWR